MPREKAFLDTRVIIDKTIELIEAEGYERFSTRRLAAALGSSVMTLYNYYENREAILREALLGCFENLLAGIEARLEPYLSGERGSPLRAYVALGELLRAFSLERPRIYAFLFEANLVPLRTDPRIAAVYGYTYGRIEALLRDPARSGELHDRIYLFQVLMNSLVKNAARGRGGIDPARFEALLAEAYSALVAPYEGLVAP